MSGKRERSENWTKEEKNLLMELVRERKVIESKSNDANVIRERKKAWMEVEKLMKASGHERSSTRIKEQWRRMKGTAKASISKYNRAAKQTGGGSPPEMPSETDWMLHEMCPDDFTVDTSEYDTEAAEQRVLEETENTVLVLDTETGTFIPDPNIPTTVNPEPPKEIPESSSTSKPKKTKKIHHVLQMTSYEQALLEVQKKNYEAEDRRSEELHHEMMKKIEAENEATRKKLAAELELLELKKRKVMLKINNLEKK